MDRKHKPRLLQPTKKWGFWATVCTAPILVIILISSDCGVFIQIKMSDSVKELLLDNRSCKVPSIVDDPEKPLALDDHNLSTENDQPQFD